ncbi:Kup system potassium uptake protein [Labilithrix luteola]|uniref:Probable potassium transport system protein Kup n=1 Tax=Labilithrix luteola TaxID=1391654 RepID=A0A0K1QCW5_9BACT|nr:KUP/HAK/KT family potassium transporter [Labilithrix luteola]AKV03255.1 Kup system potassium uptake protein [Labilithrix luteola]
MISASSPRALAKHEDDIGTGAPHGSVATLALGALGVVFGDIGTSPLYTLPSCIEVLGGKTDRADVLGMLSLVFWSLTMVVTVKYMTFVMRADNHGEGGILALLALVPKRMRGSKTGLGWLAFLVVVGAALLYGDGIITPAISVLSAMEGLEVATPRLSPLVLPLTCAVLLGLFGIQHRGTGRVGNIFGPVMVVWFVTIAILGVHHIVKYPAVLSALNPIHGVRFFVIHGVRGIFVLGAVVLAVTGGEALYADMGHFGRRPIRVAWMVIVMPALVLNYFGQGALLLTDPHASAHLFFAMVPPGPATYALVALSTCATVIASQALISGVFSLTHQAVQLGLFPRVDVEHTSAQAEGQIYVPVMNTALAIACLGLVIGFRSANRLAAAYGIAVTGTMVITSVVFFEVSRRTWHWPIWKSLPLLLLFLAFDIPFFAANAFKFRDGGYIPVLVAVLLTLVMTNWSRGQHIFHEQEARLSPSLANFLDGIDRKLAARIPGTAIFLASATEEVPLVLVRFVERVRALPEHVLVLSIVITHEPHLPPDTATLEPLGKGISRLTIQRGFMDSTKLLPVLECAVRKFALSCDLRSATYYFGRETFLATSEGEMSRLSESFFAFLARNASTTTAQYRIPPTQVVEMGVEIDL